MFTPQHRYHIWHSLLIPIKISPIYSFLYLLCAFGMALIPALQALAIARFIDAVIALNPQAGFNSSLIISIILLVLLIVASMLLNPLGKLSSVRLQMHMRRRIRVAYVDKISRLEYVHIESSESWKLIHRLTKAKQNSMIYMEERFFDMFTDVVALLQIIISITGVIIVISMQVWWIGLVMLMLSIPLMFVSYKLGSASYKYEQDHVEFDRLSYPLGEALLYRNFLFERYLFGFANKINEKWRQNYAAIRTGLLRNELKNTLIMKFGGIFSTIMAVILILLLVGYTIRGEVSVGIFLSLVTVLFSLSQTLSWDLSYYLFAIAKYREFFKDLTAFCHLSEVDESNEELDGNPLSFKQLEFRDVSFAYPGTDYNILNGVSFVMEKDKHYSFVGQNGAGKTTITKLLTGLYDNYRGEILIDGVELRRIPTNKLHRYFAVVFQDYARFSLSIRDNIAMGRSSISDSDVVNALQLSGLGETVESLAEGLETKLGKIYEGGLDISGGQWQRIAMARALASAAPVKILDEPTAALDPISESQVYKQFNQISANSTTIFISHRLGSTKLADVIFVLENGKITEEGTHEELMIKKGTYSTMYKSQQSWYVA